MKLQRSHLSTALFFAAAIFHPKAISAQTSSDLPTTIAQCEPDACATWSFHGKQGIGRWTTGPISDLTIVHFDANTVSIRRLDTTGPGKGIDGLYVGTRKGDRLQGTFTWSWPDHGALSTGSVPWYAIIKPEANESERLVPNRMTECEDAGICSTWSFEGNDGHGQWPNGVFAALSVDHFDGKQVSIRRVDTTGIAKGLTAFYIGTLARDHFEGTVIWSWPGHGQYSTGINSWHATINKVEPPSPPKPRVENALFLKDGCTRLVPDGPPESVFQEWDRGKQIQIYGLDEHTELNSLAWFCKAAKDPRGHGSFDRGQAEFEIGELYLKGFILPPSHDGGVTRYQSVEADLATAFDWFIKAADDGNTNGMDRLATLYMGGPQIKGNPKPRDTAASVTYLKKAAKRGDSWAMANLLLLESMGQATFSVSDKEVYLRGLKSLAANIATALKMTPVRDPCLGTEIINDINSLTKERDVLAERTQSGEIKWEISAERFYGDSFVCLAHLGPVTDEFLDHQLWGYFTGSPIEYWKYTVYVHPGNGGVPQLLTKRAALRQMVSEYADAFGSFVSAINTQ